MRIPPALPPSRVHSSSYHYPLVLDDWVNKDDLLEWFESVSKTRNMPWRKNFIGLDPDHTGPQEDLEERANQRAYEVWVSEISK